QELLKKINEKCEFPSRKLTYYTNLGLIPKGIKTFIPYLKGSVSWFEKKVLLIIPAIERLTKGYDLTLKEVSKYANLIHNFNSEELVNYFLPLEEIKGLNPEECDEYIRYAHKLNQHKFKSILKVYAYAKAGYEYDYRYLSFIVDDKSLISSIEPEISNSEVKKIYVRFLELKPGIKISNNEDLANLPVFKEVIFS
ncbi:MAG: hypothetical protein PHQ76_04395, partial [Caldisericia bacterium]|nr:hypothetical protein [Caldisericia bacterium]